MPVDGAAFTALLAVGVVSVFTAGAVSGFAASTFAASALPPLEGFKSTAFASSTPEGSEMWCPGFAVSAGWGGAGAAAEAPSKDVLAGGPDPLRVECQLPVSVACAVLAGAAAAAVVVLVGALDVAVGAGSLCCCAFCFLRLKRPRRPFFT